LTPALVKRVCRYIRTGDYIETAALCSGITRQTLYNWLRTGNAARDDRLAHAAKGKRELVLLPHELECVEFLEAMEQASSEAEHDCMSAIKKTAKKDWRAAAWWAERRKRFPSGYRACGEWDQGAAENTLDGVRERQAARVEWARKMKPAWEAWEKTEGGEDAARGEHGDAGTGKNEPNVESANAPRIAEIPEVIAEARKSGNAEESRNQNVGHRTPDEDTKKADVGEMERKIQNSTNATAPTIPAKSVQTTGKPNGRFRLAPGERPGMFLAGLVIMLLWWMAPQRGLAEELRPTGPSADAGSGGVGRPRPTLKLGAGCVVP
jgi:hypothetical protein